MMKRLLFFALFFVGIFSALAINPQWEKYRKLEYRQPSGNFDGIYQSINGCFNGKVVDTLTLFPFDGEWYDDGFGCNFFFYNKWILISKNGTVPSKIVESFHPDLIYEGDLDGNGKDEFGVTQYGMNGTWGNYAVFTVYNNKVTKFLDVNWWDGEEEDPQGIVMKGSKKGRVKFYTYEWNADMTKILKRLKTVRIIKFLNK